MAEDIFVHTYTLLGLLGYKGEVPMSSSTAGRWEGEGLELSTGSSDLHPLVAGLVWARCNVNWAENLETCQMEREMLLRNCAFPGK